MNLTRIFLAISFIFICIAVVPAQEQCNLNVAQSPALRGLRLGMSFEQAKKAFPDLQINRAGEFGDVFAGASKGEPRVTDKSKFDGLDGISAYFLDDRLVSVSANYDSSVIWKSVDQFTAKVSQGLRISNAWQGNGRMKCNGFEFIANINSLSMREIGWFETVEKRAEENGRSSVKHSNLSVSGRLCGDGRVCGFALFLLSWRSGKCVRLAFICGRNANTI